VTIRIRASCTACGVCLVTCPTAALSTAPRRPEVDDGRCTDCLACIEVCPADAIWWIGAGGDTGRGTDPAPPLGQVPTSAARMWS
jgi:ferredoxin